jgi:hypothetical protein
MSIACRECCCGGAFDTLVVRDKSRAFSSVEFISHLPNYYTCCAEFEDFTLVEDSEYAIVKTSYEEDRWFTGSDGERFDNCEVKKISAKELQEKLPKTFACLQ